MIHFCLVTLGSKDLLTLALASIDKYAGDCNVDIINNEPNYAKGSWAHGDALDHWRRSQKLGIKDTDIVVIMDPDVVILSKWWREEVESAFRQPSVGIWGAGARDDFGPRVHASMMCIRGQVFNDMDATFQPVMQGDWRDTGGAYCRMASVTGWRVVPLERGKDWNGSSAWWKPEPSPYWNIPLWAHLGGGTHSDPTRLTRWERIKHFREISRRKHFVWAAQNHLRDA